jgi:hypothetical protein
MTVKLFICGGPKQENTLLTLIICILQPVLQSSKVMPLPVFPTWRSKRCLSLVFLAAPTPCCISLLPALLLCALVHADAHTNNKAMTSKEAMEGKSAKAAHTKIEAEVRRAKSKLPCSS